MSLDEFYNLTVYEWLLRLDGYIRKEKKEIERGWMYTREILAIIANVNRGKDTPYFKGSDFYELSFDKKDNEEVDVKKLEVDNTEYFKKMKARFGSKIKKDGKE